MNAADAAGCKDADTGHVRDYHGCSDGGRAVLTCGDERCKVAAARLCDVASGLAKVFDLLMAQTGLEPAADDGDGRGDSAVVAYGLLNKKRCLNVLGIWHAVGDNGALKRNDGFAACESFRDFGCDVKIFVHVFCSNPV